MVKIHFLGTGAGIPSKQRNVSACIVQMLDYKDACWLFDCGEATQHQLLYSSISPTKINKVFITHLHGDHIYGLPGLLGTRSFLGATERLELVGPKGIKDFIQSALEISNTYLRYPLLIHELEEDGILLQEASFTFKAIKLDHGLPSFGYRIEEEDRPGELLVNRLKKIGVKPGAIYKEIKEGKKVYLEDGTILDGNEFVGPVKKGRIISVGGDTRICRGSEKLAENADILIHEATFSQEDYELAYNHYHSTMVETAVVAKKGNVKLLLLTHISSRYQNNREHLLLEARKHFSNSYVVEDLETYIVKGEEVIIEKN